MPFVTAGDLNVHYIEHGAGEPVLLLHGNWATCSWWEPTLNLLPSGYHGIAPDMRGRGKTEGPDHDYSLTALAQDTLMFADALGMDRFHLAGHSLGAGVALQLALDHGDRVRSLIAVAPPWVDGMPAEANSPERQQMLKANFDLFAMALKALAPTAPDDAFWHRLVAEGHEQRIEAALGAISALATWAPGDTLRSIACPKLVIAGENDILVTQPVAARAAEALGAQLMVIPGVGHSPNIEAPAVFVNLLADLWRSVQAEG